MESRQIKNTNHMPRSSQTKPKWHRDWLNAQSRSVWVFRSDHHFINIQWWLLTFRVFSNPCISIESTCENQIRKVCAELNTKDVKLYRNGRHTSNENCRTLKNRPDSNMRKIKCGSHRATASLAPPMRVCKTIALGGGAWAQYIRTWPEGARRRPRRVWMRFTSPYLNSIFLDFIFSLGRLSSNELSLNL